MIWQYQSEPQCAQDYDVSLQDAEKGFFPLWAFDINGRQLRFSCSCGFLPYGYCREGETCGTASP